MSNLSRLLSIQNRETIERANYLTVNEVVFGAVPLHEQEIITSAQLSSWSEKLLKRLLHQQNPQNIFIGGLYRAGMRAAPFSDVVNLPDDCISHTLSHNDHLTRHLILAA